MKKTMPINNKFDKIVCKNGGCAVWYYLLSYVKFNRLKINKNYKNIRNIEKNIEKNIKNIINIKILKY